MRTELKAVAKPPPDGTGDKSLTGSWAAADTDQYDPGATTDIEFTIHNGSNDQEWIIQVEMEFPPGVVVNSATSISSNYQPLVFQGSTGDGATAIWGDGILTSGNDGTTTVNLTFAAIAGPAEIQYLLVGDNYGSPPHQLSGTIVLEPTGPRIVVQVPDGGEQWAENEEHQIEFSAGGGCG